MLIEQLSIFIENRKGALAEVTAILNKANVGICALLLADTSEFGVLRLIVNDNETAETALKEQGFIVGKSKVIAVEFIDNPNGMNQILDPLCDAGINLEYMYLFHNVQQNVPIIVFRADDPQKAIEVLQENSISIISPDKLYC